MVIVGPWPPRCYRLHPHHGVPCGAFRWRGTDHGRARCGRYLLDWPSLAVSIVAAAIALFAVIYSAKSTHAAQDSAGSGKRSADAAERAAAAAERAAAAAEQQTEIGYLLAKSPCQPATAVPSCADG